MGLQNLKIEVETPFFQQIPNFGPPGITPVKTEVDPTLLSQLVTQVANQVGQLTLAVGQMQQAMVGQAFTRAAPQATADMSGVAEEVRRLSQRLDELEARAAKG
jgi:hypothetical protein